MTLSSPVPFEPPKDRLGIGLRVAILVILVEAPLAIGSVHELAFVPLLLVATAIGIVSWARGHWARAHGEPVPPVLGGTLIRVFAALAFVQLLPLPPFLLRFLSPGSYAFHSYYSLVPVRTWNPVSVSPGDTLRGIAFVLAFGLLYGAAFREFRNRAWRRRLAITVIGTGCFMTAVALWQAATGDTRIYGLWRPRWDWAVFGPYVNRNHFAGYMVMAVPLALGFTAEALSRMGRALPRRGKRRWLVLGDPEGIGFLRTVVASMVLVVGLLATHSREGILGFGLAMLVLVAIYRRRHVILLVVLIGGLGVYWVDLSPVVRGFETRGIRSSRLDLWQDAIRMFPRFPLLGTGLDAFSTAYPLYQTVQKGVWFGEAHDEYLQALLDTGLVGAALVGGMLFLLFRAALGGARAGGAFSAGLLCALLGSAFGNLVDFNWQIPANAATFLILAGLAARGGVEAAAARVDLDPLSRAA